MKWRILSTAAALASLSCGQGGSGITSPPPPPFGGDLRTALTALSPNSAPAGTPDLSVTLSGINFVAKTHYRSWVVWNAGGRRSTLPTYFVTGTQLTAVVPAALLINAGTAQVSVATGDIMGDLPLSASNMLPFTVDAPVPLPRSRSSLRPHE